MPKIDPRDLLTDKTKFPDDMEFAWTGPDGQQHSITVGEYRNATGLKSEFTRHTEQLSGRQRDLEAQLSTAQQNLAAEIARREATPARPNGDQPVQPAGQITTAELFQDPVLGPLYRELRESREELKEFKGQVAKRDSEYVNTWQRQQFTGQLERLRAANPEFDEAGLLAYVQKRPVVNVEAGGQVDLEATYRNFSYDASLKAAEARGEERGVEKGRKAASVPRIPMGRRSAPERPAGAPASVQDVTEDMVANDPEMQKAMYGAEA